jgi:hypothetical protein
MKNSLMQRMIEQPDSLSILLHDITEEQIRSRPIADKWSIFENLVHLARYHQIFKGRLEKIQNEDSPTFQQYKAENDQGFYEWMKKSFVELMNDFRKDRHDLNNYLESLSTEQLQRTGLHPVYGLINVEGWAEFFLLHEAHHFWTIAKLTPMVNNSRIFGIY